jgi:exodeoxyribonuclease V gamma subunit
VCLLGLDDGVFPRRSPHDGDDLMLREPHVGDRDQRTEDRQLLLDALLAAKDALIVTYAGRDERTNLEKPPAVPVGELLDVIGEDIVRVHPLQPFDPRNFAPPRPWSFDAVTLAGARAYAAPRAEPGPFLPGPLPPLEEPLELERLIEFTSRPVRAFLNRRLELYLGGGLDEVDDALKLELGGLETWGVGDRLLRARLDGVDARTAVLAEIARGTLPPGILGQPVINEVQPIAEAIAQTYEAAAGQDSVAESLEVRVRLPGGRLLTGSVPGVRGEKLLSASYSSLGPRPRLAAWVRLLALAASRPERAFEAVTVGRRGPGAARIALRGITAEQALTHLQQLVELYDRGMREPPPLYCKTSHAYAQALQHGEDPAAAAAEEWTSGWRYPREDAEPEHRLVLGGIVAFDQLPPAFADWAVRLWTPVLEHEAR